MSGRSSWHSSAYRDKIVVIQQRVDQVRPSTQYGARLLVTGQCLPLCQGPLALHLLVRGRTRPEDDLKRGTDELGISGLPEPVRQPACDLLRRRQGELTVLQRERLLRDDALGAAVALKHIRIVEHRQEAIVLVVGGEEVEAAPQGGIEPDAR